MTVKRMVRKEIMSLWKNHDNRTWSFTCGVCGGGFASSSFEEMCKIISIHLDDCIAKYHADMEQFLKP